MIISQKTFFRHYVDCECCVIHSEFLLVNLDKKNKREFSISRRALKYYRLSFHRKYKSSTAPRATTTSRNKKSLPSKTTASITSMLHITATMTKRIRNLSIFLIMLFLLSYNFRNHQPKLDEYGSPECRERYRSDDIFSFSGYTKSNYI